MMPTIMLLPAKEGTCPMCATVHGPEMPHNAQSVFYGMRFKMEHGRDPTWADALAHCSRQMKQFWKSKLKEIGYWSETKKPIAEPCDKNSSVVAGNKNMKGMG
jgi:hypothetical protein